MIPQSAYDQRIEPYQKAVREAEQATAAQRDPRYEPQPAPSLRNIVGKVWPVPLPFEQSGQLSFSRVLVGISITSFVLGLVLLLAYA